MMFLKQSTAVTVKIGPFLDAVTAVDIEDGLTIAQAAVRLSKNGGNIAQKSDATGCTHDELGYYDCPLNTTDTNTLGQLLLAVHATGALPVWHEFSVVTANVYDTLFSTAKFAVDAVAISGDTTAADNLEAGYDGTGYAGGTVKPDVNVATITNNAITAAAIATDAIDADSVKADAVTKIQAGLPTAAAIADALCDELMSGHTTAGSVAQYLREIHGATTCKVETDSAGNWIKLYDAGNTLIATLTKTVDGTTTTWTRS